jgi:glycosyltransferase involved in cell wall biosynthesis
MITPFPPEEKGVAEYSKELIKAFNSTWSGVDARISAYVISQILNQRDAQNWAPIFPQNRRFLLMRGWNSKSLLNQFKLFKEILKIRPDVVHLQYGPCSDYGGLLGEPFLILFGLLKLIQIPVIITLHSIWFADEIKIRAYERIRSRLLSRIAVIHFEFFIRTLFTLVDKVLVCVTHPCSEVTRRIAQIYDVPPCKIIETIHGSPIVPRADSKDRTKRKLGLLGKKILLCFGFIRKDKGYEYVIEALSRLVKNDPSISLIIAGKANTPEDFEYLGKMRKLVSTLKLEKHVIFDTRYLSEEDVINYFHISDTLLLPYTRRVGPSGPFHIAISIGIPVIGTFDENYFTSLDGLATVVPPQDSVAIEKATRELLYGMSKEETRERAKAYASEHSYLEMAMQHFSIYKSLRCAIS